MFVSKIFLIIVLMSTWYNCCSPNRVKRVINGWKLIGRDGPYNVIKYVAALAELHTQPWWTFGLYFDILADAGVYGKVYCGGALLTPRVVQTACHCIATFHWTSRRKKSPRMKHTWQDKVVIYIGVNNQWEGDESMMTIPALVSRDFVAHEGCSMIVPESHRPHEDDDPDDNGGAGTPEGGHPETIFTHDYALVTIKDPEWVEGLMGVPTTHVTFAPTYTSEELRSIAERFSKMKPVCLFVGWGDTDKKGTDTNTIRAGWTQLLTTQECIDYTATRTYGWPHLNEEEIKKYMTWLCTERFPLNFRHLGGFDNGGTAPGDSGDPVTCNSAFFGLVSGSFEIYEHDKLINLIFDISAIKFTPFENASNYRRNFDLTMGNLLGFSYRDIVRRLADELGDNFWDEVEDEVIESTFEYIIEELGEFGELAVEAGAVARSANRTAKHPRSRSRSPKKFTSINRQISFERAVQSFSDKLNVSPVLLIFILITMPFIK